MERLRDLPDNFAQDFRFAVRTLSKTPAFTIIAALSLALGIGANTAIFTLIDAVMWRMLPVKDAKTLLLVARTENGVPATGFTYEQYRSMRELTQVIDLAGFSSQRVSVSIDGSLEPAADVHLVSGNYFSL